MVARACIDVEEEKPTANSKVSSLLRRGEWSKRLIIEAIRPFVGAARDDLVTQTSHRPLDVVVFYLRPVFTRQAKFSPQTRLAI